MTTSTNPTQTNHAQTLQCSPTNSWPTTRLLFLLAGLVTLSSAALAATVSPWFLILTGLVGANQLLFVAFGACPASLVIDAVRRRVGSTA